MEYQLLQRPHYWHHVFINIHQYTTNSSSMYAYCSASRDFHSNCALKSLYVLSTDMHPSVLRTHGHARVCMCRCCVQVCYPYRQLQFSHNNSKQPSTVYWVRWKVQQVDHRWHCVSYPICSCNSRIFNHFIWNAPHLLVSFQRELAVFYAEFTAKHSHKKISIQFYIFSSKQTVCLCIHRTHTHTNITRHTATTTASNMDRRRKK